MQIKVYEEYLSDDVSGFIVIQKENFHQYNSNRVIVVNLSDSARRRRFTIAHELAHYVLHKGNDELFAHRDAGQNDGIEHEANVFATNILMPKDLVFKVLDGVWSKMPSVLKIRHVADTFAVSLSAAQVRLEQLNIV